MRALGSRTKFEMITTETLATCSRAHANEEPLPSQPCQFCGNAQLSMCPLRTAVEKQASATPQHCYRTVPWSHVHPGAVAHFCCILSPGIGPQFGTIPPKGKPSRFPGCTQSACLPACLNGMSLDACSSDSDIVQIRRRGTRAIGPIVFTCVCLRICRSCRCCLR